jgi:hypothetical protein
MKPKSITILAVFLALFSLCLSPIFSEESPGDSITITTYYPSPYGSYRELSAYRMKIGQNYSTQSVDDNNLIVEGNVGIGTTRPGTKLEVADSLYINGGGGAGYPAGVELFISDELNTSIRLGRSGSITNLELEARLDDAFIRSTGARPLHLGTSGA